MVKNRQSFSYQLLTVLQLHITVIDGDNQWQASNPMCNHTKQHHAAEQLRTWTLLSLFRLNQLLVSFLLH